MKNDYAGINYQSAAATAGGIGTRPEVRTRAVPPSPRQPGMRSSVRARLMYISS